MLIFEELHSAVSVTRKLFVRPPKDDDNNFNLLKHWIHAFASKSPSLALHLSYCQTSLSADAADKTCVLKAGSYVQISRFPKY